MNTLVSRMAGMRQGVGLAFGAIWLVYVAHDSFGKGPPIPFALPELLLGAAWMVWGIEEHFRGNRLFTALFSTLGLLVFGHAAYLLFR